MIKKFVLFGLSAIVGMVTSSVMAVEKWTDDGGVELTFKVKVEEPACTVHVGLPPSDQRKLDLGTISNKDGSIGHRLPLIFQFKDCQSVVQSIAYTADVGIHNNPKGSPTAGWISTSKPKVRLYLYQDSVSNDKFEKKVFNQQAPFPETEWVTLCYIEPKVVSGDSMAGTYEGSASFTITYL